VLISKLRVDYLKVRSLVVERELSIQMQLSEGSAKDQTPSHSPLRRFAGTYLTNCVRTQAAIQGNHHPGSSARPGGWRGTALRDILDGLFAPPISRYMTPHVDVRHSHLQLDNYT